MASSGTTFIIPTEENQRRIGAFIERLEKINQVCKRPKLTESIEALRKFLAGQFGSIEELLANYNAIRAETIAYLEELKSEMSMIIHKCQLIRGNH